MDHKVTISLFFLVIALAIHTSHSAEIKEKPLQISSQWYNRYGCPKVGSFKVECNYCTCYEPYTTKGACTYAFCYSKIIEYWQDGVTRCTPGEEFYAGCKLCTCDPYGLSASCDERACAYYSPWEFPQFPIN